MQPGALTITTSLPLRPAVRASRGQALIMAVIIMFLLAGLAGLFIAMLNQALIQTARAAERKELEDIAQAGLRHAKNQLRYSPDGADWRPQAGPDQANRGWIRHGNGFYKINVTYGRNSEITPSSPFLDNPLEKYLKIDVEARFGLVNPPDFDDPTNPDQEAFQNGYASPKRYLSRKISAYMPIGLTDYLLWITNLQAGSEAVVLGSDLPLDDLGTIAIPDNAGMTAQSLTFCSDGTAFNTVTHDVGVNATAVAFTATNVRYLPTYDGPVRIDGDAKLGDIALYLTRGSEGDAYATNYGVKRNDIIEVIGNLAAYEGSSADNRRVMANSHTTTMGAGVDPIAELDAASVSPFVLPYLQTEQTNALIQRLDAPQLDEINPTSGIDRYRALTRDSGYVNAAGLDTGLVGRGEGLYINNPDHLQVDAVGSADNLAFLRQQWLAATGENWTHGVYSPGASYGNGNAHAVQVILHDWNYDNAAGTACAASALPVIELVDNSPSPCLYNSGTGTYQSRIIVPYPRNGVLFAEGNLVIKSDLHTSYPTPIGLPASAAYDMISATCYVPSVQNGYQRPGGSTDDGGVRYYVSDTNRRFDLTIVSGGTIYIEGNLLTPSSRQREVIQGNLPATITRGDEYDSKLALLARDYVCLNPTTLFANVTENGIPKAPTSLTPNDWCYAASASNFTVYTTTAGAVHPRTRVLMRHAGDANGGNTAAVMQLDVNGLPFAWSTSATAVNRDLLHFYNQDQVTGTAYNDTIFGGPLFDNTLTFSSLDVFKMQSWDRIYHGLFGNGHLNELTFKYMDPDGADAEYGNPYLLSAAYQSSTAANFTTLGSGILTTCVDLQVDALIYAQRGSWFIIPGQYWDTVPSSVMAIDFNVQWPFPKYKEPYDVRIIVNGAIVQNRPAPPEVEEQWLKHWRGANLWYHFAGSYNSGSGYVDPTGTQPMHWDPRTDWDATNWTWGQDRRMGIIYQYDATLSKPVCYEVDQDDPSIRYYTPRLPKLPVSPSTPFLVTPMTGA